MPKRLTESEKLVRIDLWIKPATKEEVDAEASKRDLTRQAVIRERVEHKPRLTADSLARVDQLGGTAARTPGAAWAAHCRRIGLDPATEPHFSIFEAGWSAALRGG